MVHIFYKKDGKKVVVFSEKGITPTEIGTWLKHVQKIEATHSGSRSRTIEDDPYRKAEGIITLRFPGIEVMESLKEDTVAVA